MLTFGNDDGPPPRLSSLNHQGKLSKRGRNSLSALDEKKAGSLRDSIYRYVMAHPQSPSQADAKFDDDPNRNRNNRRLPPPAWNNNNHNINSNNGNHNNNNYHHQPYYLRRSSVSASSQRPAWNHDDLLLKPPPRFALSPSHTRSSMASAGPVLPAPAGYIPPYHIPRASRPTPDNDDDFAVRVARSSARTAAMEHRSSPVGEYPTPWQAAPPMMADPGLARDSFTGYPDRPAMYNVPRRLSNSSAATTASTYSTRESFEERTRSSSWGSQTTFDSILANGPRPVYANPQGQGQQPQHYPWQRPAPIKTRRKTQPGELFTALPGEVLELILVELKKLHLQPGSSSCATCWMRDCCSVAVSSRKWLKFARTALYEDIQLVGADGMHAKKRYKLNHGNTRMVLLRRTLRSVPHVAMAVRSLKVPAVPQGANVDEYNDLVASLVMACPNLDRLRGFYAPYNHTHSRLFHALSTRQRLREMTWVLEAPPLQQQPKGKGQGKFVTAPPTKLNPRQAKAFLEHHVNWLHLTTLTVHCQPGAVLAPDSLLTNTLRCLPLLQSLHLSHLPYSSFNDGNLLSLPPLKKLTLAHLPGITTAGLSSFATRPNSFSISSLTLIHIDVDSLPALARIFSNLGSLETFNIVQRYPPTMEEGEVIWLFPYLASPTLRRLHWDILSTTATSSGSATDAILARSIDANGFPRLATLRTPNDPLGLFQSLCRPQERVDLPADRYRGGRRMQFTPPGGHVQHGSTASTGTHSTSTTFSSGSSNNSSSGGIASPPSSPGFPQPPQRWRECSDLQSARLAAQVRIEAARTVPRFFINVTDEDGVLVEKHGVGTYIGTAESRVDYVLSPEEGATDEGGGLVGVGELLGGEGEDLGGDDGGKGGKGRSKDIEKEGSSVKEGCTGRWNTYSGMVVDKKDRERWWHTERGRWKGVALS